MISLDPIHRQNTRKNEEKVFSEEANLSSSCFAVVFCFLFCCTKTAWHPAHPAPYAFCRGCPRCPDDDALSTPLLFGYLGAANGLAVLPLLLLLNLAFPVAGAELGALTHGLTATIFAWVVLKGAWLGCCRRTHSQPPARINLSPPPTHILCPLYHSGCCHSEDKSAPRAHTQKHETACKLGTFDNVLSDYFWARAVMLTSPTAATVGLTLTVPIAFAAGAPKPPKPRGTRAMSFNRPSKNGGPRGTTLIILCFGVNMRDAPTRALPTSLDLRLHCSSAISQPSSVHPSCSNTELPTREPRFFSDFILGHGTRASTAANPSCQRAGLEIR